jgi:RpiR family transcriptional regulator, carbohydrate utilization regulator
LATEAKRIPTTATPRRRRPAKLVPSGAPDDIVGVIRQIAPTLRPAERRVADAILADVGLAVHGSSGDIARQAGVSEPTVTRFSRAVGCRGVRELKVRLAQSMVVGRIYIEPPPHAGTDLAQPALWRSVFQEIRRAISLVEEQLRRPDLERAAEAIVNCSRLAAFGVGGGSTTAAAEVEHRFFRLGTAVSHTSDPRLMRMIAATMTRDDVVLAISTTGKAVEVVDAAAIAKSYGALVIAITKPQTPLAANADIVLGVHVPEAPDALKPTASRYALMAVVDLLAASTAYLKPRESQDRMRRIKYELVKSTDGSADEPLGD